MAEAALATARCARPHRHCRTAIAMPHNHAFEAAALSVPNSRPLVPIFGGDGVVLPLSVCFPRT